MPHSPSHHPDQSQEQKAHAGKDVTQVGRDYVQTTQRSVHLNIFLVIFEIVALGGLAMAVYLGINRNFQNPQGNPSPAPPAVEQSK